MNQDFVDLLLAFREADVCFIVVGAYALALHAKPRATGDLDLWVEPTIENRMNSSTSMPSISDSLLNYSKFAFDFRLTSRTGCFPDGRFSLHP